MNNIVLLVDDDTISIRLFGMFLERSGYKVVTARNGFAGLELAIELHPQVVIVDDMMPEMTGGEMCRTLKNDLTLRDIPVILMSAGVRAQDSSYLETIGADYGLAKPVLPKDVLKALQNVLGTTAKT
jgi:two-component system alkaline phosphatase synthesis response regulator PhoP